MGKRNASSEIRKILKRVQKTHKPTDYALDCDPKFWRAVYVVRYGEFPLSDDDKKWDLLFREGMPILREMLGIPCPEPEVNTFEKVLRK